MQNIDVRFNATSNFGKVKADLAALQAEAASLGAVFERNAYARPPAVTDPARWKVASQAVHRASEAYRNAASSSGLMTTQQIRATSEAERYTKALQKQKLGFQEMFKHRGIMKEVYRDQLRYQRMSAQYWGTDMSGRAITDIAIPKNVAKDSISSLESMRRHIGMFGNMAASAGTQVINLGKNMQWAGRQLTVGFTYPMVLFGAAAGLMAYKVEDAFGSINKVYDYSNQALTNQNQLLKEQKGLRTSSMKAATEVAERYGLSVEKTLGVEQELAATGMTMADGLLQTTKEVQRISALGSIDSGTTTQMVIALQTAFKGTIKDSADLTHALNFMNAASNVSSLNLQDIAEATPRAATAMAQLGGTVEDMTIILTSMREAGVPATEAANAIKSAGTRIINPVPKAVDFYSKLGDNIRGAAIDIDALSKKSGGNLIDFLRLLGQEQKRIVGYDEKTGKVSAKETARLKAKGVATLFGTYQNNRLTASLVNLSDAYSGVENQTKKVMDLQHASNEELTHMAKISEKAMTETPAARLRKAWYSLQIELSELGKPFLKFAAQVLEVGTNVAEFFNHMSEGKKKALLAIAGIMALAGPAIMLTGLFFNLTGQFVKGIGTIAKFIGISKLFTKEEQAATLTAQAQNKAMQSQQAVTSTLAQEVRVLTAAYEQATLAARGFAESQGIAGSRTAAGSTYGPQTRVIKNMPGDYANGKPYQLSSQEQSYYSATSRSGSNGTQALRLEQARNKLAYDYMRANNQVARDASLTERNIAREAKAREAIKGSMNGAAIAGGVMAGSMALMMLDAGETANSIAKWGMIGSMAVPAIAAMVGWMGKALTAAKGIVVAQAIATREALAGATAQGFLTGAMVTARGAAVGFGAALNAALGPIGWITLGLTAVVSTFMIIKNHTDKIKEEQEALVKKQIDANNAMMNSSASIATNLGKAAGSYQQIANVGGEAGGGVGSESQMLKSYNYYKGEEGSKEVAGLQNGEGKLLDTEELIDKVNTKYIDLQVMGGDTAKQAKTDMQAMLLAAGMSAVEAADMAEGAYKRLGDISKIDWSKPVADQITALANIADGQLSKIGKKSLPSTSGRGLSIPIATDVDSGQVKLLEQQAGKAADVFNQALKNTTNPNKAKALIAQYMDAAMAQWDVGLQTILTSSEAGADDLRSVFDDYGVKTGADFSKAFAENADFKDAVGEALGKTGVSPMLRAQFESATASGKAFESAVISPLAKSSWYLSDGINSVVDALAEFATAGIGVTADEATSALLEQNAAYQEYASIQQKISALRRQGVGANDARILDLQNKLNKSGKALTKVVNELNQKYGFKQGRNATEALNNLLNHTKASAKRAADEVDGINKKLAQMPSRKSVTIDIKQVGGIVQSAMSNVQSAMADSAMDKFNAGWDATMASTQARQDRATSAMENRQQAAQDAFDARWEARKEAVTKAYDARIEAVQREIEAEQAADQTRQRLFEKEKARLQAIADMENTNIDFNTALNEGRLDDAAKTLNNAGVKSANDQMDAEQKAAEVRSEARIKALEKKNDRLEKQRDKEIKQLEKMEERMRKHLERVQNARAAALEKQQEDTMNSLETQRSMDEATLNARLDLFRAYTAKNKKDLERWMKELGFKYDDFGDNVTQKGQSWAESFRSSLTDQIRLAGTEVLNDNMWEKVGKGISDKLLKGLGFDGINQFTHFVKTGEMSGGKTETRHEGGVVGSGGGSRKGVPNTYKGLHRSEAMVRAQKGEYVVNRKASAQHGPILDAINKGIFDPSVMGGMTEAGGGLGSAGYGGPGGLLAGALSQMFSKGLSQAYNNLYQKGLSKQQAASLYSGVAGTYGMTTFSAEQMKNAATIATVGKNMGMSARDIEIGIMTSIAESALKNVNYGDRDSLGLFQQRPSQGWGSEAQVTNPSYASGKFFSALRGVQDRDGLAPWAAAQAVQRSAFADGSNYQRWWGVAQALFTKGLKKNKNGGYSMTTSGGFVPGAGGRHRPINGYGYGSIHDGYTGYPAVDFAAPVGTPVYAVADGTITRSYDISGYEPRNAVQNGYKSYGRVEYLKTDAGPEVLYAHLSRRSVGAGTRVQGGSVIGYTGNTGHSTGPHLHFGANNGPMAWLRKGGTVRYDNTPAMLHKGETVLTESLTDKFKGNVASGGGDSYTVTIDLRGAYVKEEVDIERAVNSAIDNRENKIGRKRVVR